MRVQNPHSLLALVAVITAFLAYAAPIRGGSMPGKASGQLFKVNGHILHLACQGEKSPTVILESGTAGFSFDWALVQPRISKETRVCAFDRAGYAWSEMTPGFEQFSAVAEDMRALLRQAKIDPPYVLAGHAFGALYARDYQRRFPGEVSGLILLDPTPEEDAQVQMFGNTVSLLDMADHDLVSWPVRPFVPSLTTPPPHRPGPKTDMEEPLAKLPTAVRTLHTLALKRFFAELDGLSAKGAADVMESQRATFTELYNARHDPATSPLKIPLIVLSRDRDTSPKINQMQISIARLSRDAVHRTATASGSQIHLERPDLVVSAVTEVARAVRAGMPLNSPGEPIAKQP